MPFQIADPSLSAPQTTRTSRRKYILWAVMVVAFISVVFNYELPLLHVPGELAHEHFKLLIIHIVAGITAFITGPTQFSNRLRRRSPRLHRILGRVYIAAVCVAAPSAMLLADLGSYFRAYCYQVATTFQGIVWLAVTAIAFVAAAQRRIPAHRLWMIRSYAVTFTFVSTRVYQPLVVLHRLGTAIMLVSITTASLFVPQIAQRLAAMEKHILSHVRK